MGCSSSKKELAPIKAIKESVDKENLKSSASQKSITFDKSATDKPSTPKQSSAKSVAGHERQKSVTAGLRPERTGSQSSGESGSEKKNRLKKKGSDSQETVKHRGSNLQDHFLALNPSSMDVREFYEGVDAEDNILGSGNWGVVKVVTRKRDGKRFACKIIKLEDKTKESEIEELRMEIDALRQLDHVAIAKLFETFEEPGSRLYLIMELLTGGDLYTALVVRSPTGRFDEIRTRKLARRMVSAIAYMHDKGLVHRDIKLENFCFRGDESEDEIVLIDFGLAKLYERKTTMTEVVGSCYYLAPEVANESYSGPSPDMWSLGVMLFMMLSGRPPFDGSSDAKIINRVKKGKYSMDDELWRTEVSTLAQDFVRRCLTYDATARMTSKEGLRHSWLTVSDEALIDAGAGDDPARALAPAVIPSVVSEGFDLVKKSTRRISASLFGPGTSNDIVERIRFFATRHALVRLFSQAVAFCVGRDEIRDLLKLFVKLDRDSDGTIVMADIEIGLLGATEEEVAQEDKEEATGRGSVTILPLRRKSSATSVSNSKQGFHIADDVVRARKKRRREAHYLFRAMDIQKKSWLSLNEFIAATLSLDFFKDEKLLGDAFSRLCGASSGISHDQMALDIRAVEGMLGKEYKERLVRRLVGEFVALARFESNNNSAVTAAAPDEAAAAPEPAPAPVQSASNPNTSARFRKLGSLSALRATEEAHNENPAPSPRRLDVDAIKYEDFVKGMMHAI